MRSGRYSASVPFLVQAPERARLLVVVPAVTWLGVDKVDDDGDGLPNTLETGGPVKWPRVIAGDQGMPATFADQTAPLLVFLDRARIRYDLTSDIALTRSRDPRATDREGVILAGPLRWVGRSLARRLRRYVEDGGRLASFGTDSLRRGVRVGSSRLTQPTQPTPTDPFGARLDPIRRPRTDEDRPAAADRARRRPRARPADRLRRRRRRVRPARGVRSRGRRAAARWSRRWARTSPTPSAPTPRRRASSRARRCPR